MTAFESFNIWFDILFIIHITAKYFHKTTFQTDIQASR